MSTPLKILGIAGSLRKGSYNRAALRAAVELAPEGAVVEAFELDGIPPFNQDDDQHPPARAFHPSRLIGTGEGIHRIDVCHSPAFSIPVCIYSARLPSFTREDSLSTRCFAQGV